MMAKIPLDLVRMNKLLLKPPATVLRSRHSPVLTNRASRYGVAVVGEAKDAATAEAVGPGADLDAAWDEDTEELAGTRGLMIRQRLGGIPCPYYYAIEKVFDVNENRHSQWKRGDGKDLRGNQSRYRRGGKSNGDLSRL
jgi:hypothetical protein